MSTLIIKYSTLIRLKYWRLNIKMMKELKSMRTIIVSFIILSILTGEILLQTFLSKKESKWLGLILPGITFAFSLLMVFSLALTNNITWWEIFCLISLTFLLANIPTFILLAIYFACRKHYWNNDYTGFGTEGWTRNNWLRRLLCPRAIVGD